jgi:uncharacterized lipoprotein YajG
MIPAVIFLAALVFASTLTLMTPSAALESANKLSMTVKFHLTDANVTGDFTVDSVTAKTTNSVICPSSNNCRITMDNQTTPSMYNFGAEYIANINLKVSITNGDTTTSKFYPAMIDVSPSISLEKAGKTTETVTGGIKLGKNINTSNPEMVYTVTNGTLEIDSRHHYTLVLDSVRK